MSTASPWPSGVGIGWRPEIAGCIAEFDCVEFCEVVAESLSDDDLPLLRELGMPVIPHGIGLSLGGAEPVAPQRIALLADCVERLDAPLVSEHVAFVRAGGLEAGHLLPVPRTRAALDALTANITATQRQLAVPLAVENIAALFDWPDSEYTEGEFLAELIERTGVYLVLDVANVYACACNRGADPAGELARLPLERIAYCHVAGGRFDGEVYHDTHTDAVPDAVLDLVAQLAATGRAPAFLLERDGAYAPAAALQAELRSIAVAAGTAAVWTN